MCARSTTRARCRIPRRGRRRAPRSRTRPPPPPRAARRARRRRAPALQLHGLAEEAPARLAQQHVLQRQALRLRIADADDAPRLWRTAPEVGDDPAHAPLLQVVARVAVVAAGLAHAPPRHANPGERHGHLELLQDGLHARHVLPRRLLDPTPSGHAHDRHAAQARGGAEQVLRHQRVGLELAGLGRVPGGRGAQRVVPIEDGQCVRRALRGALRLALGRLSLGASERVLEGQRRRVLRRRVLGNNLAARAAADAGAAAHHLGAALVAVLVRHHASR
mmetsp:Transcript_22371/g.63008  ORF Transcript_22371/g.63008 Transcript_22371/m.63008 type:complete len:277 (+) Transcript_22371:209-1039(+)